LINTFVVTEESESAFLEHANKMQRFLRTPPGFGEGFLHEKIDGEGPFNFVTTAVWQGEAAFQDGRSAPAG